MDKLIEIFHQLYAQRALMASSFVGITCGLLGCFIILRKMALIGDAISHAILPGVVVGFLFFGQNPIAIFAGALASGIFTAALITWIQRNSITKDDASIGIVFTGMFALGIIGISWLTKTKGVHLDLKDFLFGNVLGVTDTDLWLTGLIGIYVIISIIVFYKYFFISTFDPIMAMTVGVSVGLIHYFIMFLLSLTIVASLQSVGVILVVAMLIIPSSTAYLLTNKLKIMLILSAVFGLISAILGLIFAIVWETTPGPSMTLVSISFFIIALLFSPTRGIFFTVIRRIRRQYIQDQQDILKAINKLADNQQKIYFETIYSDSFLSPMVLKFHLLHLQYHGYINYIENIISITSEGTKEATILIRAHRIWESFLSHRLNVPKEHIHETAEQVEHIFPEEFINKVDQELGYPLTDPHGSPIPNFRTSKMLTLDQFLVGQKGILIEFNSNFINIDQDLKIGIKFEVINKEDNQITILIHTGAKIIDLKNASKIKVKHKYK